jgi:DNA polymerase-3 subunit delta'
VFVVGDAERMVPQASSPEAANALLKLLEEPPADTFFVLTSSRPGSLLPTIRSRVLSVRVQRPGEEETAAFLRDRAGIEPERSARLARRSGGAPGRALRLAAEQEEEDGLADRAAQLVRTALSGSRSQTLLLAASFPPAGARGDFSSLLDTVETVLRDALAISTGRTDLAIEADTSNRLPGAAEVPPDRWIAALGRLEKARDAAAGNGNPQAIAAVLLLGLARELRPARADRRAPLRNAPGQHG